MNDRAFPALPLSVEHSIREEEKRHMAAIINLVNRFPEHRLELGYLLLGGALAVVDSFGGDAEGFIAQLRAKEPMPAVLIPPTRRQS